jgi:hypothetical protein
MSLAIVSAVRRLSAAPATAMLCAIFCGVLSAQTASPGPTDAGIDRAAAELKSEQWAKRSEGFYRLVALGAAAGQGKAVKPALSGLLTNNPKKADQLKVALAGALDLENRFASRTASLPEAFTDYYGDLIMAVSAMDDPRAANALAGALGTGNMAAAALVGLGDASVDAVVRQIEQNTDRNVRQSGCSVLRRLADPAFQPPIKDPAHKQKLQQTLAAPACANKG